MRLSRILAGALLAGCVHAPPVTPVTIPPPPSATPTPLYSGMCSPEEGCVEECVVRDGQLQQVSVRHDAARGDMTYQGIRFSVAFPLDSTYAEHWAWYRRSELITLASGPYVKRGLPIVLGTTDVVPVSTFHGVTVFAAPSANLRRPDVVYIPTRPGPCEFQPYTHPETGGKVRDP